MNYLQDQVCELISSDKIRLAINNLKLIFRLYDKLCFNERNNIIPLKTTLALTDSRLYRVINRTNNMLVKFDESSIELNNINKTLLSLIYEIENYPKLKIFTDEISAKVKMELTFAIDNDNNNISDVLENYVKKMEVDHLEMIQNIIEGKSYKKDYVDIKYPFLEPFNLDIKSNSNENINVISEIANKVFSPGESMVKENKLSEWIESSPESWMMYKEKSKVKGFIHAEILSEETSKTIINGLMHEGEIKGTDILSIDKATNDDYIHIGSIVSSIDDSSKKRYKISLHLLYGLIERIMEIKMMAGISKIFTISYPDCKGNNNANPILDKMGFQANGKITTEGHRIFELNIMDSRSVYLLDLFEKVNEYKYKN